MNLEMYVNRNFVIILTVNYAGFCEPFLPISDLWICGMTPVIKRQCKYIIHVKSLETQYMLYSKQYKFYPEAHTHYDVRMKKNSDNESGV